MRVEHLSELIEDFVERAHAIVWCNVATIDAQGRVQSRLLHPIWHGEIGYIATRRFSPKARHLELHPWLSLAYVSNIVSPVYAECGASWVEDPGERRLVWDLYKQAPPPLGFDYGTLFAESTDPNFGIIRATPWRIKVQDQPTRFRTWEQRELL